MLYVTLVAVALLVGSLAGLVAGICLGEMMTRTAIRQGRMDPFAGPPSSPLVASWVDRASAGDRR